VTAIIVAAGQGARLAGETEQIPKTLLPYGEGTLLSTILGNLAAAGVEDFVVVIGYRGEMIRDYLAEHKDFGREIRIVENPEWRRGNGLSVAAARGALEAEPALLSMSDHLVEPRALRAVVDTGGDASLLLTDPDVDGVFDIPDATKVLREGRRILDIGKGLTSYNAIDCGIFRLGSDFFDALEHQIAAGRDSISDGARLLIEDGRFESLPLPPGCAWIDVDTPAAYGHAVSLRERFGALSRVP
jgi:choline kinase